MRIRPVLRLKDDNRGYGCSREDFWDAALVRLASRGRAYAVAIAAGLAILMLGAVLVREVDRPAAPVRPVQVAPDPALPSGYAQLPTAPGTLGLLLDKASLEEQRAAAKSALNRIIEGKLDQQTRELAKQLPDYDKCQRCLEDCELSLKGAGESQLRECRRSCLRTCSELSRQLMEQ